VRGYRTPVALRYGSLWFIWFILAHYRSFWLIPCFSTTEFVFFFLKFTAAKSYSTFHHSQQLLFFYVRCYSDLGRQGGKQIVMMGSGCGFKGTGIHMIMHALGFPHEHTKPDRKLYRNSKFN